MTDYTDLINELICYAENDQDFIEPQDSINTKAAQAIKALVAERDAAFAMSKCECESNEACKNLVALHDEVERLKQERDAALALQCDFTRIVHADNRKDFECSCEGMMREITTLKSALREAEMRVENLADKLFEVLAQDMSRDKAIATINEVLK